MSEQDDRDQVHKIDTVPPPDGEEDAYSAPTKVGQLAASAMEELRMAAALEASGVMDGQAVGRSAASEEGEPEKAAATEDVSEDDAQVGTSANRIPIRSEGGTPQPFLPFFGSRQRPMFTRNQLLMIGAAVSAVALGIYLLFN